MASSTTLKLPDSLKARIVALADAAGRTPHAFMVEALEAHAAAAERRREFVQAALNAEEEVAKYGIVYSADEVHRYVQARLSGKRSRRPKPAQH
jgi:predicted transcriptional regulator